MDILISDELKKILRVGVLRLDRICLPQDRGDALWKAVSDACERIGREHAGLTSGQVPGVREARNLYRAVGIDPTKNRPSSEALLRRVTKGKGLYRVHPLVDLFNLASLSSLLPVGLYDEAKIQGNAVTIRLGAPDWGYEGIRRGWINVSDRLCLADEQGPFGSPTADSQRTSIDGAVDRALAVFFQHRSGEQARMTGVLESAGDLCRAYLRASVEQCYILEAE